jgi:hypothetical protein
MALIQTQVSLLVGANGFGYWHYRTPDAKAAVHAANYFNAIASQLNVGDFICLNASDGNEITSVVSISGAGVVVVGAGTAVALAEEMKAAADAAEKEAKAKEAPGGLKHPEHDPMAPEGHRRPEPDHDLPSDNHGRSRHK